MTEPAEPRTGTEAQEERAPAALGTAAARNLASTTKSVPQMQGITSRWLLRMLPWVQVSGGAYRVNRRLTYTVGDGRVDFSTTGSEVRVIPHEQREMPLLRDFDEDAALTALAERYEQREYEPGTDLSTAGRPVDQVLLIAHGKINGIGTGEYGDETVLGVLAGGDHLGQRALLEDPGEWDFTARTVTRCTVMVLTREAARQVVDQSETLRAHLAQADADTGPASNKYGEAEIAVASGHDGEPDLPSTFADYELTPREYELSVAQTVLGVHTRVADLYNEPMDQVEQQLRLTIEALRERQEHEMINNPQIGLLHNADLRQRIYTRTGPPTPDDLDELLSRRRSSHLFLAHPKAIAAFGRECSRRGLYPDGIELHGNRIPAWRGVPIFPCNKIPISSTGTTSILVMRLGEDEQGVIGLHQTGLPDEYQPGLSVRFMGINEQAILNYLVSAYYSVAVLVPDALGILENAEIAHSYDD